MCFVVITVRRAYSEVACRQQAMDKMFSPVVAVDTFLAADWGRVHQGELLGQGTDYHRNQAWKTKQHSHTDTHISSDLKY